MTKWSGVPQVPQLGAGHQQYLQVVKQNLEHLKATKDTTDTAVAAQIADLTARVVALESFTSGFRIYHSGVQAAAQAQNTTQYLGVGSSTTENNALYVVPRDLTCVSIFIASTVLAAAGQTFTFQARKNGSNIGSSQSITSSGSFGVTLAVNTAFAQFDRLTISSVFSATSGSSTIRWVAEFQL